MKKGESVDRMPIYGQVDVVKSKCYRCMCQSKRVHHVVPVFFTVFAAMSHLFQYFALYTEENVEFQEQNRAARHSLLLNTIITVFVVTSALT